MDEEREAEIESCFSCDFDFHYLKSIEQLVDLLEVFKTRLRAAKRNDDDDDNSCLTMNFLMGVMVLEKKQLQLTYCYGRQFWLSC